MSLRCTHYPFTALMWHHGCPQFQHSVFSMGHSSHREKTHSPLLGKQIVLPPSRSLEMVYTSCMVVGSDFAKQGHCLLIIVCHFLPQLLRSRVSRAHTLGSQFNTKKIEKLYEDVLECPSLLLGFSPCSIRHGHVLLNLCSCWFEAY